MPLMRAMVFEEPQTPLTLKNIPRPQPAADELLLRVLACAVCRTDLHILDGDLPHPGHPVVLGHEIVGVIEQIGPQTAGHGLVIGQRVGVPWLGHTCGNCRYCTSGRENLCDNARFTGYHLAGGFAEYTVADPRFCFPIPSLYSDIEAAPLLCAGLIGHRALRLANDGDGVTKNLGFYGFGAAAHIACHIALRRDQKIFAFTRPDAASQQDFALDCGATWAGDSTQRPPEELDAAIIFAPAGHLVIEALKSVVKGGLVVLAGIHMSDIPSFPYHLLWGERGIRSVTNLTRRDGLDFMAIAGQNKIPTRTTVFPLENANLAIEMLRHGKIHGAAVLSCP